ncbi:MAG: hypothetical protein AMS24_02960 [Chlamydiae bacterium SM23_39]|nr:MAG: hypothetical protein AMS24_02960 [Chlamydiae bacterium SM23_39]
MSTYFEEKNNFQNQIKRNIIFQFKKITLGISFVKIGFFLIFLTEFIFFFIFLLKFPTSWILSVIIGLIIFSFFSFFMILFYFQIKKPQQLDSLKKVFINSFRKSISSPQGSVEHHIAIANALKNLSFHFIGFEDLYFLNIKKIFHPFFKKLSAFFHKRDVFKMRESLILSAVEEHLYQIKETPIDLELHVSFARTYVMLGKIYMEAKKKEFLKKNKKFLEEKFDKAVKLAIEEFFILKSFAPNDPWILSELAKCYNSLGLLEEEVKEYENLLELSPEDYEVMFKLGIAYFKLKRNAQGLQVYEELKKVGFKKADQLLKDYSVTDLFN